MKRNSCLLVVLLAMSTAVSCTKVQARMEIKQGNDFYLQEDYKQALVHYESARKSDGSFPDLDRLIGYCNIGLYKPGDEGAENEQYADRAIKELQVYLSKRKEDEGAREALVNLFLNADRTSQAIDFFREHLKETPNDIDAVRSIATLYARQGDFKESMNWYEKITLLDNRNPEAFYIFGVVLYEKVSKDPPFETEDRLEIINRGHKALDRAILLRDDYFEALVYQNLLYREEAKLAMTAEDHEALMAQANVFRNRALAISKTRQAESGEAVDTPEESTAEGEETDGDKPAEADASETAGEEG